MTIKLRNEEESHGEVEKKSIGISCATVRSIIKDYSDTHTTENKHRSGQPNNLTEREKRYTIRIITNQPKTCTVYVAKN